MGKPRDERSKDLFQPALEEIIDLGHALVRLAKEIDWDFLDRRFGAVCQAGPGQPPLPTRLVAGLLIPTCRTRRYARAGWRTPITITSVARRCSATDCRSSVRH